MSTKLYLYQEKNDLEKIKFIIRVYPTPEKPITLFIHRGTSRYL